MYESCMYAYVIIGMHVYMSTFMHVLKCWFTTDCFEKNCFETLKGCFIHIHKLYIYMKRKHITFKSISFIDVKHCLFCLQIDPES